MEVVVVVVLVVKVVVVLKLVVPVVVFNVVIVVVVVVVVVGFWSILMTSFLRSTVPNSLNKIGHMTRNPFKRLSPTLNLKFKKFK